MGRLVVLSVSVLFVGVLGDGSNFSGGQVGWFGVVVEVVVDGVGGCDLGSTMRFGLGGGGMADRLGSVDGLWMAADAIAAGTVPVGGIPFRGVVKDPLAVEARGSAISARTGGSESLGNVELREFVELE